MTDNSKLVSWARDAKEYQIEALEKDEKLIQISANTQVNSSKELLTLILNDMPTSNETGVTAMMLMRMIDRFYEIRKALDILEAKK